MLKTAIAIRHVHFENLGVFEAVLRPAGFKLHYHDIGLDDLSSLDAIEPDLLFILGGPVSVYDFDAYPFILEEQKIIATRVRANRPTVGICLGAQQIAAALGANVRPNGSKEIGFGPLTLSTAGKETPLRHLLDIPVLHWHGDAFEIPSGGINLASTPQCTAQAFMLGASVLGVQFHPEVEACGGLEEWLVGHAFELASSGINPNSVREDAKRFGPKLRDAGRRMLAEWLSKAS